MNVQNYRANFIQEYSLTEKVLHGTFHDQIQKEDSTRAVQYHPDPRYSKGAVKNGWRLKRNCAKVTTLKKLSMVICSNLLTQTTIVRAECHANIIKEKAKYRRIIELGEMLVDNVMYAVKAISEILAEAEKTFSELNKLEQSNAALSLVSYFAHSFKAEIVAMKNYANRKAGFDNLDQQQFFNPGLYVIGATPVPGKTTFCWQLLEQIAGRGEKCIYCSYEMITLELFSKTAARKLFLRDRQTNLTAAGRLNLILSLKKSATRRKICKFFLCKTNPLTTYIRKSRNNMGDVATRQSIIVRFYDSFFRIALKKTIDKLGIVYTLVEVVDFILRLVDDLLYKNFGRRLTNKNVHILDSFTGTGTFITRLIQNGLIRQRNLQRKYRKELNTNGIVLLAYYIAAINIENAFLFAVDAENYQPFDGIVSPSLLSFTSAASNRIGDAGFWVSTCVFRYVNT